MLNINLAYRYKFVQRVVETLALLNAVVVPALVSSFIFFRINGIRYTIISFLFAPVVISVVVWGIHRLYSASLRLTGGNRILSWGITIYIGIVAEVLAAIGFWSLLQAMLSRTV